MKPDYPTVRIGLAAARAERLCCVGDRRAVRPVVRRSTARPRRAAPLVLDSPHSGFAFPDRFRLARSSEFDLREGEDCFVDELYLPATERGVGLIAALAPRTYIDLNRHAGDIDLALIEGGRWPGEHVPSGKARLGKALVWRTLDDGRAIYDRKLAGRRGAAPDRALPPAVPRRRARPDRGDARALRPQLAHQLSFDERGRRRAGRRRRRQRARRLRRRRPRRHDLRRRRSPSSSAAVLAGMGYDVRVNDPYKGVELVRAYSNPAEGRMSLQLEINKRLYMDEATRAQERELRAAAAAAARRSSTPCSTTPTSELGARRGAMSGAGGDARRGRSASSSSAAPAGRCRPTRSRSTARRAGATRSRSPSAAAPRSRSRSTAAGCAARSPRRAASSRRRRRRCAPRSPAATSPAGARSTGRATPTCCSSLANRR